MENILAKIQAQVKVPKGNYNEFGRYNYRSAEDILEAVKPIVNPMGFSIICSDSIVEIGGRIYVEAMATLTDGKVTFSTKALAREEETKKGMDAAQITGSASSYARKYALNGLFALNDVNDPDATNTHGKELSRNAMSFVDAVNACETIESLEKLYLEHKASISGRQEIINLFTNRKLQLQ